MTATRPVSNHEKSKESDTAHHISNTIIKMSGDEIGTVNEAKAFHTLLNSARVSQGYLDEVETAKDPNINSECPIGPKQQSNILTAINNQLE